MRGKRIMSNELNILYQFDDNYAPYAGISMLSLFENNRDIGELNIYCATMNVSKRNKQLILENADKYKRHIVFLDTSKSIDTIKKLNVRKWNNSLATWMKIFVIEELIGKIGSLLYIDCDTLVLGSLRELCSFDFKGKAMAAVIDSLGFEHLDRLNIKINKYYYNAGIMFFNLDYFYTHKDFYKKMLMHLKKNIHRYQVNDQDLLNDFFDGNILRLSPQYNFQGIHYMYSDKTYFKVYKKFDYYSKEEISYARKHVKIVHFLRVLGNYPWEKNNFHPLQKLFNAWKAKSLWNNIPQREQTRTLFFKIEILLYRLLPKYAFLSLFSYVKHLEKKRSIK